MSLIGDIGLQVVDTFLRADRSGTYSDATFNRYTYYRYTGAKLKDSRCFCVLRKGKVYHKDEITQWGDKPGLWFACDGFGKPGGRHADTNEDTIFNLLGGYGCVDWLMPIPATLVPASVKARRA
jgi:hypothetical protein